MKVSEHYSYYAPPLDNHFYKKIIIRRSVKKEASAIALPAISAKSVEGELGTNDLITGSFL